MLILGGRYGSVEPKTGLSYTEIEYNYALELNKPFFAVVASEQYLDKKVKTKGKDILELKHQKEYQAFREKVLAKISRFFNDHNGIKLAILESLLDIQNRTILNGWIKSTEVPNVAELINQIQDLNEKNRSNEEKLRVLESGQINKIGEYTFEQITQELKRIKIKVPPTIPFLDPDGQPIKDNAKRNTDVLDIFVSNASKLSIGLTNDTKADITDLFLIQNVIAHLRIYDLAEIVKVPNSSWSRFQTSKLGNKFLAINSMRTKKK